MSELVLDCHVADNFIKELWDCVSVSILVHRIASGAKRVVPLSNMESFKALLHRGEIAPIPFMV